MAEIIQLREILAERRRGRARSAERASLEQAVALLKQNLSSAAALLSDAPARDAIVITERIEKLAAILRYGLQMLSDGADGGPAGDTDLSNRS